MLGLVCKYFNKDFHLYELAWWTVPTCWPPCFRGVLARPSDHHAVIFDKRAIVQAAPKTHPMCGTLRPVPIFNLTYSYTI